MSTDKDITSCTGKPIWYRWNCKIYCHHSIRILPYAAITRTMELTWNRQMTLYDTICFVYRIDQLKAQCLSWQGPLIAAVYAPLLLDVVVSTSKDATPRSLASVEDAMENVFKELESMPDDGRGMHLFRTRANSCPIFFVGAVNCTIWLASRIVWELVYDRGSLPPCSYFKTNLWFSFIQSIAHIQRKSIWKFVCCQLVGDLENCKGRKFSLCTPLVICALLVIYDHSYSNPGLIVV